MAIRLSLGFCDSAGKEVPTQKVMFSDGKGRPRRRRVCFCHGTPTKNLNPWSAAIPTKDATGKTRGSRKEANRGNWLLAASRAGTITNLVFCNDHPRRTYRFELYGTLAVERLLVLLEEPCSTWNVETIRRLVLDLRRAKQQVKSYTPDFEWTDDRGVRHTEDVKGRRSTEFVMSKKLMNVCFEIDVEET